MHARYENLMIVGGKDAAVDRSIPLVSTEPASGLVVYEEKLAVMIGFRYSRFPTMKNDSPTTSPLSTASLHILLALAGEDLHGYGIIQEIARQSQGKYRPGPGTLYDNLKKLMDQKLVTDLPRAAYPKDEDRRLYRITPAGRSVLSAEVERLRGLVLTAQTRLRERKPRNV